MNRAQITFSERRKLFTLIVFLCETNEIRSRTQSLQGEVSASFMEKTTKGRRNYFKNVILVVKMAVLYVQVYG